MLFTERPLNPSPSFSLLVIKTHQRETLCRFYETMGITFTEEQHGKGPLHSVGQMGEMVMEIYPLHPDATTDTTTRLGFQVESLDAVLETLSAEGAAIKAAPKMEPWGYSAVVLDPDGRSVELCQK